MKILIIDKNGITFNGNTLNTRGIGGAETAIILLSKELQKIGFSVTVLNNCKSDSCVSGIFDGIEYIDLSDKQLLTSDYDIVVSSRSLLPLLPDSSFYPFINSAQYKIVWLHDIGCEGEEYLEQALNNRYVNEIFTLSDFHTNYILNNENIGRFEILKSKIFQTRNGAVKYYPNDISLKVKHFFIYNANLDKGMLSLIDDIWPEIKKEIPEARLFIVGGYYENGPNNEDPRKKRLYEIANNSKYHDKNIDFCGIMTPESIARLHLECGFMLYPANNMPETFGISSLESLLYKTPIITCRFGALEETAISKACYILDNPLYTNYKEQVKKFVELVLHAYRNDHVYQQKQEYCNVIESDNIYTWESIALQWKQHIYYMMGMFLSKEEYKKVIKINDSVGRIFNRRFKNIEEIETYRQYNKEKHISIISSVYNAESYIDRCINSILTQDHDNYTFYIIDNNSSDNTVKIVNQYNDIVLIENHIHKEDFYNYYDIIMNRCNDDDIIVLIDARDSLMNNNSILKFYNNLHDSYDITYGSSWGESTNIPIISSDEVNNNKNGNLITFKKHLFSKVNINDFIDKTNYLDVLFNKLIENVDTNKIKVVKEITAVHDDSLSTVVSEVQKSMVVDSCYISDLLPEQFTNYLHKMNNELGCNPKVVYDIGACLLHWHRKAIKVWPEAKYYLFDAVELTEPYLKNSGDEYHIGVLSDSDDKSVNFYERYDALGGNSYYKETTGIFTDDDIVVKSTRTLDSIVKEKKWLLPDLMKLDVQGAELDILRGATDCLSNCKDIILEAQHENYNEGAPKLPEVLQFMNDIGFELISHIDSNGPDGNYHFKNKKYISNIIPNKPIKKILIAIPTSKYIKSETFKSIYELYIPEGYITEFQCFFGYRIDQIRNLIADYAIKGGYDYLFAIDSDISFSNDTLVKLLQDNKDIVSGVYVQRIPNTKILELFSDEGRIEYDDIKNEKLVKIRACGFGCVLIDINVFKNMEYPHFLYRPELNHDNAYSEDVYFCDKANSLGFSVWVDPTIICSHNGDIEYTVT